MKFKKYPKIHALHKEECVGMLTGKCHIQEKIDGANASIWMHEDGTIHCGSRNNDLTVKGDGFNGFVDYVNNHEGIKSLLNENPSYRLYGEWLVRHSIGYSEASYKQFYLFDIEVVDEMLPLEHVYANAEIYKINTAHYFGEYLNPTLEQIKELAGTSVLGVRGEGVVIKNFDFINMFGDKQYGKYVTQEFKEDNAITFGGNNKYSDTYHEMYFVNELLTLPRVQKVCHKLESELGKLDMKHTPRILNTVYHDVITEEGWTIATKMSKSTTPFDFKSFKKLCDRKTKQIFVEILTGDISVAHQ